MVGWLFENSEYFNGLYPFITPTDIHSFNEKYLNTTERTLSDLGSLQLKCNLLPKDSICSKNKNAYLFFANEKVQSVCS